MVKISFRRKDIVMPMPRRPRAETAATTIRWQRRQMIQMEQIICELKATIATKDRQLGDFELQLNETGAELFAASEAAERWRDNHDKMQTSIANLNTRLTWYEGFTHGLRQAEIYLVDHKTDTDRRSGSGNPRDIQDGRQNPPSAEKEDRSEGAFRRTGEKIWNYTSGYPAHQNRGPVDPDHQEASGLTVGEPYDGISSNRYRRTPESDSDTVFRR
jgi:hypothetical protein